MLLLYAYYVRGVNNIFMSTTHRYSVFIDNNYYYKLLWYRCTDDVTEPGISMSFISFPNSHQRSKTRIFFEYQVILNTRIPDILYIYYIFHLVVDRLNSFELTGCIHFQHRIIIVSQTNSFHFKQFQQVFEDNTLDDEIRIYQL